MFRFQRVMQKKVEDFWVWFLKNEARVFNFENDQEAVFDDLQRQLKKINKDLCFEFSSINDGKREFVISAGGIRKSFPDVIALHEHAPKLARFEVVAFRQRHPGVGMKIGGLAFEEKDVHVSVDPDGEKFRVIVMLEGVDGASEEKRAMLEQVMYLFLDSALGEYDVETRLSTIELADIDSHRHLRTVTIDKLVEIIDKNTLKN